MKASYVYEINSPEPLPDTDVLCPRHGILEPDKTIILSPLLRQKLVTQQRTRTVLESGAVGHALTGDEAVFGQG